MEAPSYFMTEDAELAARGRLVTDYSAARERIVLLEAELARLAEQWIVAAQIATSALHEEQHFGTTLAPAGTPTFTVPAPDQVATLVGDLRETRRKVARLRQQLRALHLLDE